MKKKILTILGDFYHSHDMAYNAMLKAVEILKNASGSEIELVDTSVERLGEALKQKFDLIVLYKENRINPTDEIVYNWMDSEIEQQIIQYIRNGGSWFAWHAGLASYDDNELYINMLKGCFDYHPNERNVKYTAVCSDTGIEPGSTFEVMDEHYIVRAEPADNSLFLTSESTEGSSAAGWAHQYGKGRVCCLTPTHRDEGMKNEIMLDLLKQCIGWCLRL